jgi:hypothetical protein
VGRRVHIEADDILDLLREFWVVRTLEGSDAMRLETMPLPNPLHGPQRNAHGLGHGTTGPMGRGARWLGACQLQNSGDDLGRERRAAGLARLVPQQAVDAFFAEALLPAPNRRPTDAGPARDFQNRKPLGRMQHDLGALDVLEGAGAIGRDRFEALSLFAVEDDADGLGHEPRLAYAEAFVNPMSASVH